ncbi:MAG: transcription elongation factor GreAB [Desulfuromonadaceae bacterium GWC2_58_13]|nr:MAG: transcription elongation factor GreAB [Desulfuromonadaceae bacterium GWC2_58_13]
MTKNQLLQQIIATLNGDLAVLSHAARTAHAAATHQECLPDNKYDTTALEASYIAQGQANRAQEIRGALEAYRKLEPRDFDEDTPIRLTALITLVDEAGISRQVFLGPEAGGLKIPVPPGEIVIITPGSPLGRGLIGKRVGDQLPSGPADARKILSIEKVS